MSPLTGLIDGTGLRLTLANLPTLDADLGSIPSSDCWFFCCSCCSSGCSCWWLFNALSCASLIDMLFCTTGESLFSFSVLSLCERCTKEFYIVVCQSRLTILKSQKLTFKGPPIMSLSIGLLGVVLSSITLEVTHGISISIASGWWWLFEARI